MDIHKFIRRLNIKRYMASSPIQDKRILPTNFQHSGLANASQFNPPGTLAPSLKVFSDVVLRDLDQLPAKKVKTDRDVVAGLNSLCENKGLVIRPADKGGGIIIIDKKDYLTEMHRILGDVDTYTPLRSDPKVRYKKELEVLVQKGFELSVLKKKEVVPGA